MRPSYAFLLTFLFVSACEPAWAFSRRVEPRPSPTPIQVVIDPSPTPWVESLIEVEQVKGATEKEMIIIDRGVALANTVVKSPCFRQWVRAAHYSENRGMSQTAIDGLIQIAHSKVRVEMYTGTPKANYVWRTVGFEADPYDGWVHMNRHFVKTPAQVADNLLHEDRGHQLGFRHDGKKSTSEPYGMNYAFEGCTQQMMQARGGRKFKPPGVRLEIRRTPRTKKKKAYAHAHH